MKAYLIAGLGFGDEGKGTITDAIVRRTGARWVVRYNGGAQAAHNVVANGLHHTFSQFGSGTLAGAKTYLSKYMQVDPISFMPEALHLHHLGFERPCSMVYVNRECVITDPFHRALNRLREIERGSKRHGSCGMGIGETMYDVVNRPDLVMKVKDLENPAIALEKLETIRCALLDRATRQGVLAIFHKEADFLIDRDYSKSFLSRYIHWAEQVNIIATADEVGVFKGDVVMEGAQGVLLDEWFGFHPYTTWSTTTFENAYSLLEWYGYEGIAEKVGVIRAFHTRHGAGPFPTERFKDVGHELAGEHNTHGQFQGDFRIGFMDCALLKYAIKVAGQVDYLALTHLDKIDNRDWFAGTAYTMPGYQNGYSLQLKPAKEKGNLDHQSQLTDLLKTVRPIFTRGHGDEAMITLVQKTTHVPVNILSYGPDSLHKNFRELPAVRCV
jgi:adenylosuccinate synthase